MIKSIRYFEEECSNKFEKLEDDFMKEPSKLAEYVTGLTEELHNLGLRMIQESLEQMDEMLNKSPKRLQHWVVESQETDHFAWRCEFQEDFIYQQRNRKQ